MTELATYLSAHEISDAEFADLTGKDRSTVNRWKRGKLRPSIDEAAHIEIITDGEVPMKSWASSQTYASTQADPA